MSGVIHWTRGEIGSETRSDARSEGGEEGQQFRGYTTNFAAAAAEATDNTNFVVAAEAAPISDCI
jgi:hypothetical protein